MPKASMQSFLWFSDLSVTVSYLQKSQEVRKNEYKVWKKKCLIKKLSLVSSNSVDTGLPRLCSYQRPFNFLPSQGSRSQFILTGSLSPLPGTFSLSGGWHDAAFRSLFRIEEFMNSAAENVVVKLPLIFSSLLKCLRRSLSSPISWSGTHPVVDQWGIYKC